MEQVKNEREALQAKIKEQGAGAASRWMANAESASVGNKKAKAECERLLGHEVKTMLDLYNIQAAAFAVASVGEKNRSYAEAVAALKDGHDVKNDADAYLANRLGKIRREKGMTQKELAQKAGMPVVTLQKLENGASNLLRARTETTLALAKAMGITVEELVDGKQA